MKVENSRNLQSYIPKQRRGDDGGIMFTGVLGGVITQSLIKIDTTTFRSNPTPKSQLRVKNLPRKIFGSSM